MLALHYMLQLTDIDIPNPEGPTGIVTVLCRELSTHEVHYIQQERWHTQYLSVLTCTGTLLLQFPDSTKYD